MSAPYDIIVSGGGNAALCAAIDHRLKVAAPCISLILAPAYDASGTVNLTRWIDYTR